MTKLIAIDPGDVHVGVAFFDRDDDGTWYCSDTQEFSPDDFAIALVQTVTDPTEPLEWIVYERFRLYEDKSGEQRGSEFLTSQLIGVIKFIHRIHSMHMDLHDAANEPGSGYLLACELQGERHSIVEPHRIQLVGQMADIKKPAAGILRHKKIKSTAKQQKTGGHCVDAELHGYYHILHTLEEPAS